MRNEHSCGAAYADILGDNNLHEFDQLLADLETLYRWPEPPIDLRASTNVVLRERAADRYRNNRQRLRFGISRWPVRRLPNVAVFAIALVALFGLAFTFNAIVLNRDPGMQHVAEQGLSKQLNLVQTRNGFTVTLHSAYADENRILVEYSVDGPPDRTINSMIFLDNSLVNATGVPLPFAGGRGEDVFGAIHLFIAFDASKITGNPVELSLHLRLDELDVNEVVTAESDTATPADESIHSFTVSAPFEFDFTVPFYASRVVALNQSLEAQGQPVVLEKVVTSPSQTRVHVRGITSEYTAQLEVDGQTHNADPLPQITDTTTGKLLVEEVTVFEFSEPLYDKPGAWKLTILPPHG